MRSTLPSGLDSFSFAIPQKQTTSKQLQYLHDLHIHLTGDIVPTPAARQWEQMPTDDATDLIRRYLQRIPRYQEYEGPEYGTPAYDALSDEGKRWADSGMIPDSY